MDVYVRSGDSLWYYSQLFKVPFRLIIDSNRNIDPQTLSIGARIQIPGYVTTSYQIKSGIHCGLLLVAEIFHWIHFSLLILHLIQRF